MSKKIVYSTFIALVLLVSCGKDSSQSKGSADEKVYPVKELKKETAVLQSVYPVTIRGEEDAEIKPRVSGYIDKVFVEEGAHVSKGQALFSINSPTSQQDLASAMAALETANASLNTAKLNVDRVRPLAEKDIVSATQLQTYENAYATAQANKKQAEVALQTARATTSWTTVTSPIDGVVGSIPYRSGNMVTSSTTITTVAKTGTIYAYFSLNEKVLAELLSTLEGTTQQQKIKSIPQVELIMADGTTFSEKGKIAAISGAVDVQTGSVTLRAEFPNKTGLLRSGASGKIAIPRNLDNVFVIPQKATFSQQNKIVTYIVVKDKANQNDSTVQTIISVLALPDGKSYAVTEGLNEGERIVLDGVATLANARKIKTSVAE